MKRRFNVTGSCTPQRHYMVRLDDRHEKELSKILLITAAILSSTEGVSTARRQH